MNQIRVTFKVHEDTVLSAPWLTLTNDDSRQNLFPQIWLSLLHGGHHHVSDASWRKTVKSTLDPLNGNDVQIFRTGVVSTIHRRSHWKTQRHAKLVSSGTTATWSFKSNKKPLQNHYQQFRINENLSKDQQSSHTSLRHLVVSLN